MQLYTKKEQYLKKWHDALVSKGHNPILNADGKIDMFAMDYDIHNGPVCIDCGMSWCHYCKSINDIEPCLCTEHHYVY